MNNLNNAGFAERLSTAANAKKAQLAKLLAQPGVNDPAFAERESARLAIRVAREARMAERKTAREALAAEERKALETQQAAAEAERVAGELLQARESAERAAQQVAKEQEAKLMRDARYAARKARSK